MQSTFTGIEVGKRGLVAHTQGLSTVGHNVSNASVEGYSRQRVEMRATDPLYNPALNREETAGQIGQGVDVASISRVKDVLLEGRIVSQANHEGYWQSRDKYLLMLEKVYNEPTDVSVRNLMDRFWESWQELSLHPEEMAARQSVLKRGQALIDGIHERYHSLSSIRNMLEDDVSATTDQINAHIREIASLNEQIIKVKAMGDNPNDLLDRRDLLTEKLSGLISITVDNRDPDEFTIHTGGRHLVQGAKFHEFIAVPTAGNDGFSEIRWKDGGVAGGTVGVPGEAVRLFGGKLSALVELRDSDVRKEIQNLDLMTVNFTDLVNEIHQEGYGINGSTGQQFFTEYPAVINVGGNYDSTGDGTFDSTYIFRVRGTNSLDGQQQIGIQGVMTLSGRDGNVEIPYFPADTVSDLVRRINTSGAEVYARLDRDGRLTLKGAPTEEAGFPDFVIRHIEDSGQFLTGYAGLLTATGADGAFDWQQADAVLALKGDGTDYAVAPLAHPSGWIEINQDVVNDPLNIVSGFGRDGRAAETGDGTAALAVANLRNQNVMIGRITTFDDYFADTVAEIGLKGQEAQIAVDTQDLIMKDLRDMRDSISGVNIDEELAQMIKFQHGYSAAARYISEVNKMLDTIINRMGV